MWTLVCRVGGGVTSIIYSDGSILMHTSHFHLFIFILSVCARVCKCARVCHVCMPVEIRGQLGGISFLLLHCQSLGWMFRLQVFRLGWKHLYLLSYPIHPLDVNLLSSFLLSRFFSHTVSSEYNFCSIYSSQFFSFSIPIWNHFILPLVTKEWSSRR